MKKGQQAVEFLMTYGWVLLVVLVGIAALGYFGILTPGKNVPEACILFPGLSCDDFRVNEEGVNLVVTNGGGKDIESISFSILEDGACGGDSSNTEELKEGNTKTFTINCTDKPLSKSSFNKEIQISYTEVGGLDHNKKGQLSTKVE